jgi:predicted Zn-dependent protease
MNTYLAKMSLLRQLYEPAEYYINSRGREIIKENNMINGFQSVFGQFRFKGQSYEYYPDRGYSYCPQFALDGSLEEKAQKLIEDIEELKQEKATVERGLSILLSQGLNSEELREILGDNIYSKVSEHLDSKFKTEKVSDMKFNKIIQESKFIIETIQKRIVDNLISKSMYGEL